MRVCRIGSIFSGTAQHDRRHVRELVDHARALCALEIRMARAARHRTADNLSDRRRGPNPSATPASLDVLRDGGAFATFFLIDAHVTEAAAPIVRRMIDEGHTVALHFDTRALLIKTPGRSGRASHPECRSHRTACRLAPVPPVQAACRLAQRIDV